MRGENIMIVVPCKDCEDRHAACHCTCERYKRWKEDSDKIKAEINKNKYLQSEYYSAKKYAIDRVTRKDRK